MNTLRTTTFDAATFLANAGLGRRIVQLKPKQVVFAQGSPADAVFYLQKGRADLTVVSKVGKEATITLLAAGRVMHEEHELSDYSYRFCWPAVCEFRPTWLITSSTPVKSD